MMVQVNAMSDNSSEAPSLIKENSNHLHNILLAETISLTLPLVLSAKISQLKSLRIT